MWEKISEQRKYYNDSAFQSPVDLSSLVQSSETQFRAKGVFQEVNLNLNS